MTIQFLVQNIVSLSYIDNVIMNSSYSFEGQDLIMSSLLREISTGTYLDIGCNHPIIENNTYHLYTKGWRGVCVDGNNDFHDLYLLHRPEDKFINSIVTTSSQSTSYIHINSDSRLSTCSSDTLTHYKSHPLHLRKSFSTRNVVCSTLDQLIN